MTANIVKSRTMKSVFGIKTFSVYTVGLLCICVIFGSTGAKTDTTCYGVSGLPCTTHRLICNNNTVINITKAYYGYRSECNDANGLINCNNTECCKEKTNDCHKPFTVREFQIVSSNCTGQQECSVNGLRRYDNVNRVCNDSVVSAYSKIEYTCISSDNITITTDTLPSLPPTLPPETTTDAVGDTSSTPVSSSTVTPTTVVTGITYPLTDSTNTAIVGGVLGFLCIVLIIIIILLVVYIKRRPPNSMPISDTQPKYDGLEFHSMEENTNDGQSNYDMIESNAAHINPAFISEENVQTKTADPTYENIEHKKRKKRKKKVTKSIGNNNISEQSPNYLDVSQSPAPIYMNT